MKKLLDLRSVGEIVSKHALIPRRLACVLPRDARLVLDDRPGDTARFLLSGGFWLRRITWRRREGSDRRRDALFQRREPRGPIVARHVHAFGGKQSEAVVLVADALDSEHAADTRNLEVAAVQLLLQERRRVVRLPAPDEPAVSPIAELTQVDPKAKIVFGDGLALGVGPIARPVGKGRDRLNEDFRTLLVSPPFDWRPRAGTS